MTFPFLRPSSAIPNGARTEIIPFEMLASSGNTNMYSPLRWVSKSKTRTLEFILIKSLGIRPGVLTSAAASF